MSDCLFCGIARGEIEASVVYEDDDVVAFDDIMPQAPVHTLIVPKEHYEHLGDGVSEELIGRVFSTVREVARLKGVEESGYRVIVNNGGHATQTVPHLHIHVVGGAQMSHGMVRLAEDEGSG